MTIFTNLLGIYYTFMYESSNAFKYIVYFILYFLFCIRQSQKLQCIFSKDLFLVFIWFLFF